MAALVPLLGFTLADPYNGPVRNVSCAPFDALATPGVRWRFQAGLSNIVNTTDQKTWEGWSPVGNNKYTYSYAAGIGKGFGPPASSSSKPDEYWTYAEVKREYSKGLGTQFEVVFWDNSYRPQPLVGYWLWPNERCKIKALNPQQVFYVSVNTRS